MEPRFTDEPPEDSSRILKKYLKGDSYESKRRPHVYRAGDVWACHRQLFYKRRGVTPEREAPYGIFEAGKSVEESFTRAMRGWFGDDVVAGQFWIKTVIIGFDGQEIIIRGKPDVVLLSYNLEPHTLYEVKSKSSVKDFTDMAIHQRYQGGIYEHELKKKGLKFYYLVYISRNNPDEHAQFDAALTDEDWNRIEDYFRVMDEYDTKDQLPPAIPMEDWQCDYCDFKQRCKADGGWSHETYSPGAMVRMAARKLKNAEEKKSKKSKKEEQNDGQTGSTT
jgi:CRISPR-associated exonuclease Cas4